MHVQINTPKNNQAESESTPFEPVKYVSRSPSSIEESLPGSLQCHYNHQSAASSLHSTHSSAMNRKEWIIASSTQLNYSSLEKSNLQNVNEVFDLLLVHLTEHKITHNKKCTNSKTTTTEKETKWKAINYNFESYRNWKYSTLQRKLNQAWLNHIFRCTQAHYVSAVNYEVTPRSHYTTKAHTPTHACLRLNLSCTGNKVLEDHT